MRKRQYRKLIKQINNMPMNIWFAKNVWSRSQMKAHQLYHDRVASFCRLEAKKYRDARKERENEGSIG